MDPTLYDICTRAVGNALLKQLVKDPLRGITTPVAKRAFLKDVREDLRRQGYGCDVEAFLRGSAPTVVVTIKQIHVTATYSATFDLHRLSDLLSLHQNKVSLN